MMKNLLSYNYVKCQTDPLTLVALLFLKNDEVDVDSIAQTLYKSESMMNTHTPCLRERERG